MKTDFSKIKGKLTQKGRTNLFLIIGILGIIMISVGDMPKVKQTVKSDKIQSLTEYKCMLEKEVEMFLKEIDGTGDVKVMISLESGEENIYAQQEKTQSSKQGNEKISNQSENIQTNYENQYVIIDEGGADAALIEKTIQPTIKGVAVVCSGADDIYVVTAITDTLAAVLDVPTHKICVTKMR